MTPKLCCQYAKLNQRPVTVLCAYETEFSCVKLPLDIGKMFSHQYKYTVLLVARFVSLVLLKRGIISQHYRWGTNMAADKPSEAFTFGSERSNTQCTCTHLINRSESARNKLQHWMNLWKHWWYKKKGTQHCWNAVTYKDTHRNEMKGAQWQCINRWKIERPIV